MSKAKDKYYGFKEFVDENFDGVLDSITDYVKELEEQNKEMLDCLVESDFTICYICKMLNPHHKECTICDDRKDRIKIIEKQTGKKIEEILK